MTAPPNAERPPHEATGDVLSDQLSASLAISCAECGRLPAQRGWVRCSQCLREYAAGIRRRRAAEMRLEPLGRWSA